MIFQWSFNEFYPYLNFIWINLYFFHIQNGRHSKMADIWEKIKMVLTSPSGDLFLGQVWLSCAFSSSKNLPDKNCSEEEEEELDLHLGPSANVSPVLIRGRHLDPYPQICLHIYFGQNRLIPRGYPYRWPSWESIFILAQVYLW